MSLKDLKNKKIRFFLTQSNDTGMYLFKEYYFGYLVNLLVDKIGFRLKNIEAEIVFPFKKYFNNLIKNIDSFDEEYFVFYFENAYHSNYYGYKYIVKCLDELKVKNTKKKVILYSLKMSSNDALELIKNYDFVDLVIRTDIEFFFNEYFYKEKSINDIPNIIYRNKEKIIENIIGNVDYDLNEYILGGHYSGYLNKFLKSKDYIIGILDDDILPTSSSVSGKWSKDTKISKFRYNSEVTAMISTGRGCKYNCSYCYRGVKYSKVRQISLETLKKDLDYLKEMNYVDVYIYDDCFLTTNFDRLEEILDLLSQYDFYYGISIRYEMCIPKIFEMLKKVKFYRIQIGLQSTSNTTNIDTGRSINIEKFTKIVRDFRSNGIKVSIDLILGLPGDKLKDFINSFNFAVKLDPGSIHINTLFLNPGTKLYENKSDYGIKVKQADKDLFSVSKIDYSDSFSKLDLEVARRYVGKISAKLKNTKVLLR